MIFHDLWIFWTLVGGPVFCIGMGSLAIKWRFGRYRDSGWLFRNVVLPLDMLMLPVGVYVVCMEVLWLFP